MVFFVFVCLTIKLFPRHIQSGNCSLKGEFCATDINSSLFGRKSPLRAGLSFFGSIDINILWPFYCFCENSHLFRSDLHKAGKKLVLCEIIFFFVGAAMSLLSLAAFIRMT